MFGLESGRRRIDRRAATGDASKQRSGAMAGRTISFSFRASRPRSRRSSRGAESPRARLSNDLCASYQAAVVDVLVRKSRRALALQGLSSIGSAAASLRTPAACVARAAAAEDGFAVYVPSPWLGAPTTRR